MSASLTPTSAENRVSERAEDLLHVPVAGGFTADIVADEGPGRWAFRAHTASKLSEVHLYVVHAAHDLYKADVTRMRRMKHPNVGRVLFDASIQPDRMVLVTPPNAGTTMAETLSTRGIGVARMIRILRHTCEALDAFHQQGRVYGHLTPEHVILRSEPDGNYEAVLLPAWWLWRHGVQTSEAGPWHAPDLDPEAPTQADDAWALGALAWHGIVGHTPPTPAPRLQASCDDTVPALLDALVAELLSPNADERPTNFVDIAEALGALDSAVNGGPGPIAPPMLMNTPVPVGGQLRTMARVLSVPPPERVRPAPDPRAGVVRALPEPVPSHTPPPIVEEPPERGHIDEVNTLSGPYPLGEVIDPTTSAPGPPTPEPEASNKLIWLAVGVTLAAAALTLATYLLMA